MLKKKDKLTIVGSEMDITRWILHSASGNPRKRLQAEVMLSCLCERYTLLLFPTLLVLLFPTLLDESLNQGLVQVYASKTKQRAWT